MHQVLSYKVLKPEAVCCCLQTCKCGFGSDFVCQCTKCHSQECYKVIGIKRFYCLRLFVVVYKPVIVVLP